MNDKTLELIKNNLKDPSLFPVIQKTVLKKARIIALVLGSFLIIALIAVVYAFVQQTKALTDLNNHKTQLEACMKEAELQHGLAEEARMIAQEANQMAMEELKKCQEAKSHK